MKHKKKENKFTAEIIYNIYKKCKFILRKSDKNIFFKDIKIRLVLDITIFSSARLGSQIFLQNIILDFIDVTFKKKS